MELRVSNQGPDLGLGLILGLGSDSLMRSEGLWSCDEGELTCKIRAVRALCMCVFLAEFSLSEEKPSQPLAIFSAAQPCVSIASSLLLYTASSTPTTQNYLPSLFYSYCRPSPIPIFFFNHRCKKWRSNSREQSYQITHKNRRSNSMRGKVTKRGSNTQHTNVHKPIHWLCQFRVEVF